MALGLVLVSAIAHAAFGALQKGRHNPWLTRGAIDGCYGLIALPFALFAVPWPDAGLALVLGGAFFIHTGYKWLMAMAYDRGAFTAVYPIVRGTGPLATVAFAGVVFGEHLGAMQWLGVATLSGGIFALAALNLARETVDRPLLARALGLAFATGLFTALYTTYDAYGIRLAPDPFTFLAWFFVVDGIVFPLVAARRWRAMAVRPPLRPLLGRGLTGAMIAFLSFGAVMLATRLAPVGEVAALRETSVVFAGLIGWAVLGEPLGWSRAGLMAVIAGGAVLVEIGG